MPRLDYKKFTLSRVYAFAKQILHLKELDFPYIDSSEALDKISEHIKKQYDAVANSVLDGDALKSRCARATNQLFIFQRFLGYISKSSEPINSFEIYFSFRRIAETILGDKVRLIISSEWEYYSPVNFTIPPELGNFVFIGLPVSESDNALIVPLSGHELGHSIWDNIKLENKYRNEIQQLILKDYSTSFDSGEISYMIDISIIKCIEYFCDFIGIGLFGESYIYAFAYLIAPKISKSLNQSHPNATNRAIAMTKAAIKFGYEVPDNLESLFKTQLNPHKTRIETILEISEGISLGLVDKIIQEVEDLLHNKNILYSKPNNYLDIMAQLESGVPVSLASSLADITNAAWDVYFIHDKWNAFNLPDENKKDFLNELIIKSFEILEINQRLQET